MSPVLVLVDADARPVMMTTIGEPSYDDGPSNKIAPLNFFAIVLDLKMRN